MQARKAVETKNILSCAEMISSDYHDKYGNDRQTLLYIFREAFGYYKQILVHIQSVDITLDESKVNASVEIAVLVVGRTKANGTEKILEGEKGKLKIGLVKEDKEWRLVGIESFEPITIMGQDIS